MQKLAPGEPRRVECLRSERNCAMQVLGDAGKINNAPVGFREHALVARDDENIRIRGEEDLIRRKVLIECREHHRRECVVELVEVQPLSEHTTVREMRADASIELRREQPRYAADPGIRWFAENEVETPAAGGEEGFCVIENEMGTRVFEVAPVRRIEEAGCVDHLRLDLDGREMPNAWAAEE